MPSSAPIRFENVDFNIDGAPILRGLSMEVRRGETLVLLGRSGSGKTTALRLINRLIDPSQGAVLVDGKPTIGWDSVALRRSIGYVIQHIGLFPHFTVARNVGLVPTLEGRDAEWVAERVRSLLILVGLDPDAVSHRRPSELSGGQQQRVGVARALAADPPILLMDEPFASLDPITRRRLQTELAELKTQLGKTTVFVTHDVREALLLADRIAFLDGGRLVWLGDREEFQTCDHDRVRDFREAPE